ncbi:SKP1-like protein 1A [Papaver somniferum]|uniref:SKP1-like protein 1A n=1 Tax=Papaver somniferum TaxID=3469 RepID=UPI000E6F721E|nr:SKP1-like protein 1A [Papaver somniferum]
MVLCEGVNYLVSQNAIGISHTIKHAIEGIGSGHAIPLPNVRAEVLEKVIEYCDRCFQQQSWPAEYAKSNEALLFEILLAADYLNIASLQNLMCQAISGLVMGKSGVELRSALNIQGNFDADEEAHLRNTLTGLGCVLERQD